MSAVATDEQADPLEQADDALLDLQLVFLSGKARPRENAGELHDKVWKHFASVVAALAVLQDDTPREICEQGFGFAPSDEQWRNDLLPRLREAAAKEIEFDV